MTPNKGEARFRDIKFCNKCGEYLLNVGKTNEECSNPGCPVRIYDGEDTPQ